MAKTGEWIIVHPTDVFTAIPVWQCTCCEGLVSGYNPPDKICSHCGAENTRSEKKNVELAISELEGW